MISLIPMAGDGARVQRSKGPYRFKPFITYQEKKLVEWAMSSVADIKIDTFFWIVRRDHFDKFPIKSMAKDYNAEVVILEKKTMGAADTVRQACEKIGASGPGIILDSDLSFKSSMFSAFLNNPPSHIEGALCYFESQKPIYSYIDFNKKTGWAVEIKEKEVISPNALLGCYFFSNLTEIHPLALSLINTDIPHGEIYISHLFEKMIVKKKKIKCFPSDRHKSLGSLEELE